jgi:O-antigen ligase
MSALGIRSVYGFGAFVLLGVVASLAISSVHAAGGLILLLLAPLLVLVVPKGLTQAVRGIARLVKSLRWWHVLWLLVYVSGLAFRVRGVHEIEQEAVDNWAMFRIALVALTALVLLMRLARRQTPWLGYLFRGLVGILATYGLICVASTLWSAYPAWTLYKSLEYLVDIVLLVATLVTIRSTETYRNLFNWTWALYGLSLTFVWLEVVVWPQEALTRGVGLLGVQLQGVLPSESANTVGEYGAVLAIVALSRLLLAVDAKSERAWYGLLFAAGLITMLFAQTRSAIAGFALGAILVLLVSKRAALSAFLGFGTILILSWAAFSGLLWDFLRRGESEVELRTLSGRITWWQFAWQKFLEHPLLGYGAYAGGKFVVLAQNRIDVGGLHSDFAELLVGTGVLGLALALIVLLGTWWALFRALRNSSLGTSERQLLVGAIGVLGVISTRSLFTNNLFNHPPLMFFAILGYAEFLRRRRVGNTGCAIVKDSLFANVTESV